MGDVVDFKSNVEERLKFEGRADEKAAAITQLVLVTGQAAERIAAMAQTYPANANSDYLTRERSRILQEFSKARDQLSELEAMRSVTDAALEDSVSEMPEDTDLVILAAKIPKNKTTPLLGAAFVGRRCGPIFAATDFELLSKVSAA